MIHASLMRKIATFVPAAAVFATLCFAPKASAQDYGDRDRGRPDPARVTRIEPGTLMAVRTTETIDVDRRDDRIYDGTVDQDVRGENGRLAIPRGAPVELIVRVEPDNDLVIDVDSVTVNGQRYALQTNTNRQESVRDNSLVGSIVGAIQGGQAQGRAVRVPRGTVLTFRIQRPLEMGVADRGEWRDGRHYHDWEQ